MNALKQERAAKVLMLKREGMTYLEIGRQMGISRQRAQQLVRIDKRLLATHCEKCGGTDHIHGHHSSYEPGLKFETLCAKCHKVEHALVNRERWKAQLLNKGTLCPREAAKIIGQSLDICRSVLKEMGIHRRSKYDWSKVDWSLPNGEIAKNTGIDRNAVCNMRRTLGLPRLRKVYRLRK